MYEEYRNLCRKSLSQSVPVVGNDDEPSSLHCFVDSWNFAKVELLSLQPLVALFHDIVSKSDVEVLIQAVQSDLEIPRTVSAQSGQIKSDVQKRTGKVAFVYEVCQICVLYTRQLKNLCRQHYLVGGASNFLPPSSNCILHTQFCHH